MIYEPREDTYLLNKHVKSLDLEGKDFLEIGVGSGLVIDSAREKGAKVTAVDINQEALDQLDDSIEKVRSDLFENIEGKFDLVVFNPPYLPGDKEESGMEGSETWYGGERGVEVSERFLEECEGYLKKDGEALIVASTLADVESLIEDFGLEIVDRKSLFFEELVLLRHSLE